MSRALLVAWMSMCAMDAQIRFVDVTNQSGLDFILRNDASGHYHQVELMPGGVATLDYNNDGCADIYFTNGAELPGLVKSRPQFRNRLFRGNCDLTFTDVTARAGVAGEGYSMAVAAADYDNDGDTDIFVAGVHRKLLYRNDGNGSFTDVTSRTGLDGEDPEYGSMWSISAGWFDADNDGLLDLFVSNYVDWDPRSEPSCGSPERRFYCHPQAYESRPSQLFRNRGDGSFEDVSRSSGIAEHVGKGMGVAFGDFNDDGNTDIFVANDSVRNHLFKNLGAFRFDEVGLEMGVALAEDGRAVAGMGADFRDVDDDGDLDIILTAMLNDTFLAFINHGKPFFFEDSTIQTGLAAATRALTGWGLGIVDFDNDGLKDLLTANSHFPGIGRYAGTHSALPNSVFRGLGKGRFVDASPEAGGDFQAEAYHRCLSFADFDNDGRVDFVVTAINGPAKIYQNISLHTGHWLAINTLGKESNRDGLGARISLLLPDGKTIYNHVTTSIGYASSVWPVVHFGLGANESAVELSVKWPSGKIQTMSDVRVDRVIEAREP